MLFVILSLLLLKSPIAITDASPVGTADPPSKGSELSLLNTSNVNNVTLSTNFSDAPTLPTPLPYGFHVPGTETYLRLGFGLPRRRLDPMSLTGLIAVVQHIILEGIRDEGADAEAGVDPIFVNQRLKWTLGDGFHLKIYSVPPAGAFFTWGQLENVLRGLKLYLIDGGRYYAVVFNFWDGPMSWWNPPLGSGAIALGNEDGGTADQKL